MPPPKPTDAELAILRVLWQHGPATVRAVHEALGSPGVYTTTLKLLQIMTDKRLVTRDESQRSHIYHPAVSQQQTQRRLVRDLLDRAFGGSSAALVLQALSAKRASPKELAEIRKLLDAQNNPRDPETKP